MRRVNPSPIIRTWERSQFTTTAFKMNVPTLKQTFAEFKEIERLQAEEQHAIECGFHDDWVEAQRQINLFI